MSGDISEETKSATDFLNEFYSLEGVSLKEREHNLYSLLRKYCHFQQSKSFLDDLIENNDSSHSPRTHLEEIFFIDTLIYFKHTKALWKLFKEGNEIVCNKLAHKKWFFQQVLNTEDFSPEEFVQKLLPTVSYSVRLKLLNKLQLKQEIHSDQVFEGLLERYGLYIASFVFHNCSKLKIHDVLETDYVPLTANQLLHLVDKDFDLFKLFLSQLIKFKGGLNSLEDTPVFAYIAQKYPDKYWELRSSFRFVKNLGRRTTKKVVVSGKALILEKPKKYSGNLHQCALVHKLGADFKAFLLKIFPKNTLCSMNYQIRLYLQHYPRPGGFHVYRNCYNSTFHEKFGENIDIITEDVLQIVPDADLRQKLAKRKLEKTEDDKYLKFYKPEVCLEIIKMKLESTTNSLERTKYVGIVMGCCMLNRDYDVLITAGDFFAERLKNDVSSVFSALFQEFDKKRNMVVGIFKQKHYDFLLEILSNKVSRGSISHNEAFFVCYYLQYLLENGKPIDKILENFAMHVIKCIKTEYQSINPPTELKPTNVERILEKMLAKSPLESKLRQHVAEFDIELFVTCIVYNKRHPKYPVDPHSSPRMMESWKIVLEDFNTYRQKLRYNNHICKLIESRKDTPEMREILDLYFKNVFPEMTTLNLEWLLKNRPDIVNKYLSGILEILPTYQSATTVTFAKLVKKYTHLGMDSTFKDLLTENIELIKVKNVINKHQFITLLSIILSDEELLQIVDKYKPTTKRVDLKDLDLREDYLIQCHFASNLKRLKSPKLGISLILKFCVSDYLARSLATLYSFLSRTPEQEVIVILEQLLEIKAVSVKKHGLLLAFLLLDYSTTLELLRRHSSENNFKLNWAVLKYFAKNPTDDLWKDVEEIFEKFDVKDNILLNYMSSLPIPLVYKGRYNYLLWSLMTKGQKKTFKGKILKKMRTKDREFAVKVIEQDFLVIEEANTFVANFLLFAKVSEKFEIVKKRLEVVKKDEWGDVKTRKEFKQKWSKFVTTLVTKVFQSDKIEILEDLPSGTSFTNFTLLQVFTPVEAFKEYVWIHMLQCKGKNTKEKAKIVYNLASFLVNIYGTDVLVPLASSITQIYEHILQDEFHEVSKLCYSIFQCNEDDCNNRLFVINLFSPSPPEDEEGFICFDNIVRTIQSSSDDMVLLRLNLYLALD